MTKLARNFLLIFLRTPAKSNKRDSLGVKGGGGVLPHFIYLYSAISVHGTYRAYNVGQVPAPVSLQSDVC